MSRSTWLLGLAVVGGIGLSAFAVQQVLTYEPLTAHDFELVEGRPLSVTVMEGTGAQYVELRFAEDPIRYRVGAERLEDFADPAGFVETASARGATVRFHIERGARQDPVIPPGDPDPVVFAQSMTVNGVELYPLERRLRWDRDNHTYAQIAAVVLPLITFGLAAYMRSALRG